jgi:hypothetical protein
MLEFAGAVMPILVSSRLRAASWHRNFRPAAGPSLARPLPASSSPASLVVYAKKPFGGPEHVLYHLARDTHQVDISNHRLTSTPFRCGALKVSENARGCWPSTGLRLETWVDVTAAVSPGTSQHQIEQILTQGAGDNCGRGVHAQLFLDVLDVERPDGPDALRRRERHVIGNYR